MYNIPNKAFIYTTLVSKTGHRHQYSTRHGIKFLIDNNDDLDRKKTVILRSNVLQHSTRLT